MSEQPTDQFTPGNRHFRTRSESGRPAYSGPRSVGPSGGSNLSARLTEGLGALVAMGVTEGFVNNNYRQTFVNAMREAQASVDAGDHYVERQVPGTTETISVPSTFSPDQVAAHAALKDLSPHVPAEYLLLAAVVGAAAVNGFMNRNGIVRRAGRAVATPFRAVYGLGGMALDTILGPEYRRD